MLWAWILLAAVIFLLVLLFLIGNFFFSFALNTKAKYGTSQVNEKMINNNKKEEDHDASFSGLIPTKEESQWFKITADDIYFHSQDGLKLHARTISRENSHRYAILCHGYLSTSKDMVRFAKKFHDFGFHCIIPDARAHGKSEGTVRGMGYLERKDIALLTHKIIEQDEAAQVILFGISMGGATVMMTSGEPLPPQVKLIIEDCGYSSVWSEFAAQLHNLFHLPSFPIMNAASIITKLRGGYSLKEADAVKCVKKCRVPMLFIHGDADDFVPFSMLEEVYEAATCKKEKLVVHGAGHGLASSVEPERYWKTIAAFLQKHMDQ